ncbi:MAG: type II toxin-antitoxin system VapC family toxin [Campylobacterota bacterium]|nr:type II toxin-antitoxin system VapC family toxin [Campylobacterota bacterium]
MSSVFLDTNFFLDIFDASRERHPKAKEALEKFLAEDMELYTGSDILSTISYFLQKRLDIQTTVNTIEYIVQRVSILVANNQDFITLNQNILKLLETDTTLNLDYEDCMQLFLAHKYGVERLLTSDNRFCQKLIEQYSVEIINLESI